MTETLLIFQKPYDGKAVASILAHGAGALNVDGGRIATNDNLNGGSYSPNGKNGPMPGDVRIGKALGMFAKGAKPKNDFIQPQGRWPANLLLSHTPFCGDECHAECPVRLLDEQSGIRQPGARPAKRNKSIWGDHSTDDGNRIEYDTGGASRFFFNADWHYELAENEFFSQPKKRKKLTSKSRTASMSKIKIVNADVIEWAKKYRGPKFHALFCDAPYCLSEVKQSTQSFSSQNKNGRTPEQKAARKGFMGKAWDNEIAMNPDTWRALAEHLLPGAFLFVFAGTLNDDLISVAMRQAGLRKFHKVCLWWSYGSGFPKSSRIDTAVDKAAKAERKILGKNPYSCKGRKPGAFSIAGGNHRPKMESRMIAEGIDKPLITAPATPLAKTWAGHRYGLQAIKPAAETILIFAKPFEKGEKPVDSITKNGSGALNVDAARIPGKSWGTRPAIKLTSKGVSGGKYGSHIPWEKLDGIREANNLGRWPANLVLQHSPDCNGTCSPECVVRELDEQTSHLHGAGFKQNGGHAKNGDTSMFGIGKKTESQIRHGDTGGASRFFYQADWNYEAAEKISDAASVRYCAKASRKERDAGLSGLKSHDHYSEDTPTPMRDHRKQIQVKNNHPTVKPISLCKYLATLLLPPSEYGPRRICVPFAGVASEAIGAMLAGWEEVTAIEKEQEYCNIGRARARYWQTHKEPVKQTPKKKPPATIEKKTVESAELFPELA